MFRGVDVEQLFDQARCLSPTPTAVPQEFVTIQIPYGTTVLQPGLRLPVISRDAQTVRVRYMNEVFAIPVASTHLR
jgi:hypothetical protein